MIYDFIENSNGYEVNEYFATDFVDDTEYFEKDIKNKRAIDFLTETSYEIDCENYSDLELDDKIKKMLEKALKLIEE